MRQIRSMDLGLIFLLTAIFVFVVSYTPVDTVKYGLEILIVILLSLFSGYSITALLKPAEGYKSLIKHLLLILGSALLLIIIIGISLKVSPLGFHLRFLILGLSGTTILFVIAAFVRRNLWGRSNKYEETTDTPTSTNASGLNETPHHGIIPETAIKVIDVGMEFNLSQEKIDNIKEYAIKFVKRELFYQEFWALKGVNFQVEKGDKLGIVGLNGAGKSTLLKLISGVMKPTEGKVEVSGSLVPLLELGAGFDPNYTGRENIFLNGALLGYPKDFIESKYDEILEFSEIGDFIDVPLKNYSTGMIARLGFSIATIVEPQILILDEILSVGDAKFQEKSEQRMKSFINQEVTVLFVSHSAEQVRKLCNKAIWLEKGKLIMQGEVNEVCDKYLESMGIAPAKKQFNDLEN
jgi:ABC-type polysaccharide/polyol phosphate transport system ATPase subunit